jgi:hypothetical protein
MSIYAQFDNGEQRQFASNQGWADVVEWSESLDAAAFPEIAHLCDHAYEQQLESLESQLTAAMRQSTPREDVAATLNNLLDALAVRGDADAVFITDGMTSADDDQDSLPSENA